MAKSLKSIASLLLKYKKNLTLVNLVFIFVFLNIWDFILNRIFFNGMILGIIIFGPSAFLWFVGKVRASALVTLISIVEFVVIFIFVAESFEISGKASGSKFIFWFPYLLMAGVNAFWGLKIYSEYKENLVSCSARNKEKKAKI